MFQLNGHKVLEVNLSGSPVKALSGSMIAYEGQATFKKASMGGGEGLKGAFKRKVTGEGLDLMEMSGSGTVYLAHKAAEVVVINLHGETLAVEAASLLALSPGLSTNVTFSGLRGASSGQGLFTTEVKGNGQVAVLSEGTPIVLEVSPQYPLVVDPDAYICSKGQLNQTFVTDVSWRNVTGESNGEAFSLRFDGSGVVYIQPKER